MGNIKAVCPVVQNIWESLKLVAHKQTHRLETEGHPSLMPRGLNSQHIVYYKPYFRVAHHFINRVMYINSIFYYGFIFKHLQNKIEGKL